MNFYSLLESREINSKRREPNYFSSKISSSQYMVGRLRLSCILDGHEGCINTVRWNSNGTKIVSGSDDCQLGIYEIDKAKSDNTLIDYKTRENDDDNKKEDDDDEDESAINRYNVCDKVNKKYHMNMFKTGHTSNLFHALFVPNTNDRNILSCALDNTVRYNIIDKNLSNLICTHSSSCHKTDIIDPNTFISCSEDGTVKLMDLRDKTTINNTQTPENVKNTIIYATKIIDENAPSSSIKNKFSSLSSLRRDNKEEEEKQLSSNTTNDINNQRVPKPKMTKENVCCYTMSLNPLNNNILSLGCKDKWIRLYDRRYLSPLDNSKKLSKNNQPYHLFTTHELLHKKSDESRNFFEEGVTGLAWSYDGKELVATYSSHHIALFNLHNPYNCKNYDSCNFINNINNNDIYEDYFNNHPLSLISHSPYKETLSDKDQNNINENELIQNFLNDSDNKMDTNHELANNDNNHDNDDNEDNDNDNDDGNNTHNDNDNISNTKTRLQKPPNIFRRRNYGHKHSRDGNPSQSRSKSPIFFSNVAKSLKEKFQIRNNIFNHANSNTINNKMLYNIENNSYKGHRTVKTIKECNFYGPKSEYIISGSDCGHVFIWDKNTSKVVNILKGDATITNVVQGNPYFNQLVTSGLDHTVKVFEPIHDHVTHLNNLKHITEENEKEIDNPVLTIPIDWLVALIANRYYYSSHDEDVHGEEEEEEED